MTTNRPPKGPGLTFAALAVVLLVVLSIFVLTQRQPPPPTIAEFAPQAVDNITDAPQDQSGKFGRAAGGEGGGATPTPPASAPDPVPVARVRKCVGDPPRQIEDPQSPPCVPFWSGDNGGATSRGVTRDQVIIANPGGRVGEPVQTDLENFFNKRFEFYGRKLKFVAVPNQSTEGPDSQLSQQSSAVYVDQQVKPFASTLWDYEGNTYFATELARRQIVNAATPEFNWTSEHLRNMSPYTWQYPMAADEMFANLGEWMCKRLVGGMSTHAGAGSAGKPRVFGVILRPPADDPPISIAPLQASFSACGGQFKVTRPYPQLGSAADPSAATNMAVQLQTEGVTTALCLCTYFSYAKQLWQAASRQAYFPEWAVSTFGSNASSFGFNWGTAVPDQAEHAFGLSFEPMEQSPDNEPFVWAVREVDAGYNVAAEVGQHRKRNYYRSVLILASGIQMAGPKLTPETFAAGLRRTRFPNPDHPNMAGDVGFGDGSSMTRDAAEFWWSNSARAVWPNPHDAGSVCYVAGGARHSKGTWPSGEDPFFRGACR